MSDLYGYAETLVYAAQERSKPNGERLPGYTDSALPLTKKSLLDAKPVYPWLDELTLEWSLSKAREYLGADDPDTKLLLGQESPEQLAKRLVEGSKLADANCNTELSARTPKRRHRHLVRLTQPRCSTITPFGVPVEPDV